MAAIDRVRVMVLGDSGVGKTSLVHLIAYNEPIRAPRWTVGCSVEVKLHEYKEGTPEQTSYFIELWDVGGSKNHRNTRSVFYNPCHGVILVHDLTNRKSEDNLRKWLHELTNRDSSLTWTSSDNLDAESFLGCTKIPMLVIGTKMDLIEDKKYTSRSDQFSSHFGADEIVLDCRQPRYFAAGTTNAVKMSRFFDKVIEERFHTDMHYSGRFHAYSPVLPSKFYTSTHQD